MGRRSRKDEGFNAPFSKLKALLPKTTDEAASKGAPSPGASGKHRGPAPNAITAPEEDDETLFKRAMSGVVTRRDDRGARVEPPKNLERQGPNDEALALMELESFVRGDSPFSLTDTEELQYGLAPGVTQELLSSLKRGDFAFHRHVDLHGLSREEAHAALNTFITEARRNNERCVLVITGRGKSSPDGISVLKESLPRWLSRAPLRAHVLAFCTAQPVHGGPGAFYVLLRRQGQRPFGIAP